MAGQPGLSTNLGSGSIGIQIILPAIPLWVPDVARQQLGNLVLMSMHLALQEAAGRISDAAPVSEGILAQSFGADPATTTGGMEIFGQTPAGDINGRVFSALPYAIVMDQGRRIGAPISRAGIDAIGLWAQRKLGLTATQAEHAKWAIAQSIIKHGFPGTGYFGQGVKAAEPGIQRLFAILGDQITKALTTEGQV